MSQIVRIKTIRGATVQCIVWNCESPTGVIITAAGAGGGPGPGGSDGPYCLYERLAANLPCRYNISVIQIVYHVFSDMQAAVDDILAAIDYTKDTMGSVKVVLIGWSMGGAAVVEAAYQRGNNVNGIITIGGQTVGGENANQLHPETAFAILHGTNDTCINPAAAQHFYSIAGANTKKNLVLNMFPGEDHGIQGAWDFLVSGKDAYLRHLFCISKESWNSQHTRQQVRAGVNVQAPRDIESSSDKLFYVLLNGQLIPVPCLNFVTTRIGDIKQWFAVNHGINSENQEYIFNGVTLQDHLTLSQAGITAQSTIRLQNLT